MGHIRLLTRILLRKTTGFLLIGCLRWVEELEEDIDRVSRATRGDIKYCELELEGGNER